MDGNYIGKYNILPSVPTSTGISTPSIKSPFEQQAEQEQLRILKANRRSAEASADRQETGSKKKQAYFGRGIIGPPPGAAASVLSGFYGGDPLLKAILSLLASEGRR